MDRMYATAKPPSKLIQMHLEIIKADVKLPQHVVQKFTSYEKQLINDAVQAGRVHIVPIPIESYEEAQARLSVNKFYNRIKK